MNIVDVAQALQAMHIVGEVLTADISATWVDVGETNILRVEVAAATYFAFSDNNADPAVTVATSPAVKILPGEHYIICSAKYVRASANPTRVELLRL